MPNLNNSHRHYLANGKRNTHNVFFVICDVENSTDNNLVSARLTLRSSTYSYYINSNQLWRCSQDSEAGGTQDGGPLCQSFHL